VSGQSGAANGAYDFNANARIATSTNTALTPQEFTASFWIRPQTWTALTASAFIAKRTGSTSGVFIFYLNATTTLHFDCGGTSGSGRWNTAFTPPLNTWSHIVLTCNANGRQLFVNGAATASNATGGNIGSLNNASTMMLGADGLAGGYDRIFNRVLSQEEAASLYSANAQ
jgi:hypothetical protein